MPKDAMSTTTQLLRHINAMRILRILRRGQAMSRADIARELQLTRATVGNAMLTLLHSGLVMEGPTNVTESRVGRPGVEVSLDPTGAYSVGIEIGMRSVSAVVVDLTQCVVAQRSELIGNDFRDADLMLNRVHELIDNLIASGPFAIDKTIGVGVAIPGLVDHEGVVINAPFLGW
ncbi:MAG TPA: helix-turn-helix domain-containing protein, partial [Rhizobium sp.]